MADGDWTTSIVVEDGTGTLVANSYISIADARAYNVNRGLPFPAQGIVGDVTNDAAAQAALFRAMDYIESYKLTFIGCQAFPLTQTLSWPRTYVDPYAQPAYPCVDITGVPAALARAQARLCSIVGSLDVDLYPVITTAFITSEQIGPIKTTYDPSYGTTSSPILSEVDAFLNPYLDDAYTPTLLSQRA